MYEGIVITGTSGSGKSTIGRAICERDKRFELTTAVTTRSRRADDQPGEYRYCSDEQFSNFARNKELLTETTYRGERYGIILSDYQDIVARSKIPVLVLTPDAAFALEASGQDGGGTRQKTLPLFLSIFLDAPDKVLDERLQHRGESEISSEARQQREEERKLSRKFLYYVLSEQSEDAVSLVHALWFNQNRGGVLPARLISLMFRCGMLMRDADPANITSAAYDLRLGDEYYYRGKIHRLSERSPFLLIEPYDYAIVMARECADFPRDICGRFDLSVGLFCQGIILSNGPQVDPGFRGRLLCLLFNTSNSPVLIKRGQHYATIEFHKLLEPAPPYEGEHQDEMEIVHYIPSNAARGAVSELRRELEEVKQASQRVQSLVLAVMSVILAIIAVLLALH